MVTKLSVIIMKANPGVSFKNVNMLSLSSCQFMKRKINIFLICMCIVITSIVTVLPLVFIIMIIVLYCFRSIQLYSVDCHTRKNVNVDAKSCYMIKIFAKLHHDVTIAVKQKKCLLSCMMKLMLLYVNDWIQAAQEGCAVEPFYSGHPWDSASLKCPDQRRCPHFTGVVLYTFVCNWDHAWCPD